MTAFNTVRFKVKPGSDQAFLDAHQQVGSQWPGLIRAHIIKAGEGAYCLVAEWRDTDALAEARPAMIATLNSFRDTLDDLGEGRGLTDAVSGPVVMALR